MSEILPLYNLNDNEVLKHKDSLPSYKLKNFKTYLSISDFWDISKNDDKFMFDYIEGKINEYLIDINQLKTEYRNLIEGETSTIILYLRNLCFSDFESDSSLVTTLYHILGKIEINEIKFYIFQILPRIKCELSFFVILKYQYYRKSDFFSDDSVISNNDDIFDCLVFDFKYPDYSHLAENFILSKMDECDRLGITKMMLMDSCIIDLLTYIVFCHQSGKTTKQHLIQFLKRVLDYTTTWGIESVVRIISTTKYTSLLFYVLKYCITVSEYIVKIEPQLINDSYLNYVNGFENCDVKMIWSYKSCIKSLRILIQTIGTIDYNIDQCIYQLKRVKTKKIYSHSFYTKIISDTDKSLLKLNNIKFGKRKKPYTNPNKLWEYNSKRNFDFIDRIAFYRSIDTNKSRRTAINEIREELGFQKIGEKWISETKLFYIVSNYFESLGVKVYHHYRPKFLNGQELDIYFEYNGKKVGIEYQGKQHFEPVDFFGGIDGYEKIVERDRIKKHICHENNIELIYINYNEEISIEFLKSKIDFVVI